MRVIIAALLFVSVLGASAVSQEPTGPTAPLPHTTFLLIDASGSMKDKFARTEAAVAARIKELVSVDSQARVSRTYFRAKDRNACWQPVQIAEPVPASSTTASTQRFFDDFTPLGAALEAAILKAGAGPADILIFSDERQTEQCGIDICAVARQYLPRSGINVQSIPVGADAGDHDRLGCLEGAQGKPLDVERAPAIARRDHEVAAKLSEPNANIANPFAKFIETWAWLVAFLCVAGSSAAIGYKHSNLSVYLENQTNEAKSLRDLIRQGDPTAEAKINELARETNEKISTEQPKNGVSRWFNASGIFFAGGVLALVLLATLPGDVSLGGFLLGNAKAAAWSVLNSDFSTAFAVTWIAIVFFAGSQDQRRREAQRSFAIATNEAKRLAEARQTEDRKRAYDEYVRTRAMIESIAFDAPNYTFGDLGDFNDVNDATDFESDLERVAQEAIDVALGDLLSPLDAQEIVVQRTADLRALFTVKPRWIGDSVLVAPDLATFVERVRSLRPFGQADEEWARLPNLLRGASVPELRKCIDKLIATIG